ncbi:MAG: glycosyltransferase-like protein [Variovorax sp.]|nr:glycosyltransferase-like protein [Variovorax sp.]
MMNDLRWGGASERRVLHVVGSLTDEVFGFLAPATRTLAKSGHSQSVLVVDELRYQHNVRKLDGLAALIRVPKVANPVRQWKTVLSSFRDEVDKGGLEAVHVHGLFPYIIGSFALRPATLRTPVVYSLHGSGWRKVSNLVGQAAMLAARPAIRMPRSAAIIAVPDETHPAELWKSAERIESPVHNAFFEVGRHEADFPVVFGGGQQKYARALEIFTQLAVLLSGEELGLRFHWIGAVDRAFERRLAAADVTVMTVENEEDLASKLSGGWVCVAPWSSRIFPSFLVQAMAAGLPCVAFDCERHREVLAHGVTGFLCASEQEMVRTIAMLVDDAPLRARIGAAARAAALARFSEVEFEARLLSVYPPRLANAQPGAS